MAKVTWRLYGDYSVSRHHANNPFFTSCHRNQIVTWRYKCFNTSHKQFFMLVPIGSKGYIKLKVFRDLALRICFVR